MRNPNRNLNDDNDDDDDDSNRKPPAKEIHVVKTPNKSVKHGDDDADEDNDSPADSNLNSTSGETSLASTSTYSAEWVSPVARALPRNKNGSNISNRTPSFYTTPTPIKKGGRLVQVTPAGLPSLTAATPCSPKADDNDDDEAGLQKPTATVSSSASRAQSLQRHVYLWIATVAVAVVVFIYQILPAAALTALLFIMASIGMMTQTVVTALRHWHYETVIAGNGLGRWLLPDSLYRTLTETSLHEFMTDPEFGLENRHLLLYFLPLSEEQLVDSIERLAPQHRDRLYRPGLGHLMLGESLMRLLLGEPRYQQLQQQQQQQLQPGIDINATSTTNSGPIEVGSPPPQRQRLLLLTDDGESDAASDLGLDVATDDLAATGGLNQEQAVSLARRLGLEVSSPPPPIQVRTPPPTSLLAVRRPTPITAQRLDPSNNTVTEDGTDDYANQELQVLMDAFWGSAYGSVWNPLRGYVSSALVLPTVNTATRFWAGTGILLSATAGSFGLWGWWTGVYTLSSSTRAATTARERATYPPSWTIWTTAIVGGTSIGLSTYARHYVRRAYGSNESSSSSSSSPSKTDSAKEELGKKDK